MLREVRAMAGLEAYLLWWDGLSIIGNKGPLP